MEEYRLRNLYGEQFGTGYAGNVWDSASVAPAIMTMQGGGRQPHIVSVNPMEDGTCRTIKSQYYKNSIQNLESEGTFGCSGVVQVNQATEKGYTECLIGGGWRI